MNIKELQIENNVLKAKLKLAIYMLQKAKHLTISRRRENQLLKDELVHKTTLLHEEMLAHEQTNLKLAQTMHRLSEKFSKTIITIDGNSVAECPDDGQHNI